ncbi:MAG: hypothetical protein QM775_25390 [Pirellulales bacterium]
MRRLPALRGKAASGPIEIETAGERLGALGADLRQTGAEADRAGVVAGDLHAVILELGDTVREFRMARQRHDGWAEAPLRPVAVRPEAPALKMLAQRQGGKGMRGLAMEQCLRLEVEGMD